MKFKSTIFLFIFSLWSTLLVAQEQFEVEGAIIIQNSEDATPTPGTIRFNPDSKDFEGWNGVFWASLTGFELATVTDIDGNEYKTIKIGSQEWMAENLRVRSYDSTFCGICAPIPITEVQDPSNWKSTTDGAWCHWINNSSYEIPYGKLYNWYAVNDSRGLCPSDWHVPSDAEWTTMIDHLGGTLVAGGKIKEEGFSHWASPNQSANNKSGFTVLPAGFRTDDPMYDFFSKDTRGNFWTSTSSSIFNAWSRETYYISEGAARTAVDKNRGYSVRCVRD